MLSVVTMAASNKHLEYTVLMERLDLADVRELEDLLIECIYAEIIVGRLDQQSSQLKVVRVSARDPSDLDIASMCEKLDRWGLAVDNMIAHVDNEATIATDQYETEKLKVQALKDQVDQLKKTKSNQISVGGKSSSSGGWAGGSSGMSSGGGGDGGMAAALAASRRDF